MAYTRGWNDSTPPGSRASNQIDDAIREFKVDLHERMDSALVVDWLTDPVVPKATILGNVVGRIMTFGAHVMDGRHDEDDCEHQDGYFQFNSSGMTGEGTIYLPSGITIKKLEAVLERQFATSVSIVLYKCTLATGAITVLDTATRAVAGIGTAVGAILNPPGINDVVDSTLFAYGLRMTSTAFAGTGPRFYAARLTVDVPNNLSVV